METLLFFSALALLFYLTRGSELEPLEIDDDYSLPNVKEDEEIFHHPVTGYSGNRENMDAYIQNREKKLRDYESGY